MIQYVVCLHPTGLLTSTVGFFRLFLDISIYIERKMKKLLEKFFFIVLNEDMMNTFQIASTFLLGYVVNNFKLFISQTCLTFLLLKAKESN